MADAWFSLRRDMPSRIELASRSVPPTPLMLNLSSFGLGTSRTIMRHSRRLRAPRRRGSSLAPRPFFFRDGADLAALAATLGLPTICEWREMAEQGCLLSLVPGSQLCIGARPVT